MADVVEHDLGSIYAQNMFVLERELGASAQTQENSLLLKYFSQLEYLKKANDEEEKQMKKSQRSSRFR